MATTTTPTIESINNEYFSFRSWNHLRLWHRAFITISIGLDGQTVWTDQATCASQPNEKWPKVILFFGQFRASCRAAAGQRQANKYNFQNRFHFVEAGSAWGRTVRSSIHWVVARRWSNRLSRFGASSQQSFHFEWMPCVLSWTETSARDPLQHYLALNHLYKAIMME